MKAICWNIVKILSKKTHCTLLLSTMYHCAPTRQQALLIFEMAYALGAKCLFFLLSSKKNIIVNFIIQKLKIKHTSLKKYTNWAKLSEQNYLIKTNIFFSRFEGTTGESRSRRKKPNILHLSLCITCILVPGKIPKM